MVRVYMVDGQFKTMVVDSAQETRHITHQLASKLSLLNTHIDYSEYRLFEMVDGIGKWPSSLHH